MFAIFQLDFNAVLVADEVVGAEKKSCVFLLDVVSNDSYVPKY